MNTFSVGKKHSKENKDTVDTEFGSERIFEKD